MWERLQARALESPVKGQGALSSRAEYYRVLAARSAQRAAEAADPLVKKSYEDLGRQWLHLAGHAERAEFKALDDLPLQPD